MKTPQIAPLPDPEQWGRHLASLLSAAMGNPTSVVPLNPKATDEKTVAERKWKAPLKPGAEQKPCDVGLFSDDSKQTELF